MEPKSNYAKIQFCDQQVHFASLQFGCQNCEMQVFKKLSIAKLSAACFSGNDDSTLDHHKLGNRIR